MLSTISVKYFSELKVSADRFQVGTIPDIDERGICFYYSGLFQTVDTVWSTFCNDLIGNWKENVIVKCFMNVLGHSTNSQAIPSHLLASDTSFMYI